MLCYGGPSTYFERSARAPARPENVIFHKGNGLETPSSEFSGLRMRDGVLPLPPYPVRGLTEYSLKLMAPTPQGGGPPSTPRCRCWGGAYLGRKRPVLAQLFGDRRFPREKPSKQKKTSETSVLSLQRSRNRWTRRVVVWNCRAKLRPGLGPEAKGGAGYIYASSSST